MTNLAAALQSSSAAERRQAIEQLKLSNSKLTDSNTVSLLLDALADEHAFVRWQAGLVLAGQEEGLPKLVQTLKNGLTSPSSSQITDIQLMAAIDALAANPSPVAYGSLVEALNSPNALLRQSAAEALAAQKNPDAIPHLIKATKDSNPWVRRAAAYALGHLGQVDTAHTLVACLRDEAVIVRRSAAYALGALRAELAGPQLLTSLTDKDPLTRRNAAWALGRIGWQQAVPALTQLLNDVALDGRVATAAHQAIEAITKPRWLQILLGWRKQLQP